MSDRTSFTLYLARVWSIWSIHPQLVHRGYVFKTCLGHVIKKHQLWMNASLVQRESCSMKVDGRFVWHEPYSLLIWRALCSSEPIKKAYIWIFSYIPRILKELSIFMRKVNKVDESFWLRYHKDFWGSPIEVKRSAWFCNEKTTDSDACMDESWMNHACGNILVLKIETRSMPCGVNWKCENITVSQ